MKAIIRTIAILVTVLHGTVAFQCPHQNTKRDNISVLYMSTKSEGDKNSDFMRWAKQSRSASFGDNLVELNRPLGLVLNQDDQGNVYVETVAPKGNAARTGKVRTLTFIHIFSLCSG